MSSNKKRKWHFVSAYSYVRNGKRIRVAAHGRAMPKSCR